MPSPVPVAAVKRIRDVRGVRVGDLVAAKNPRTGRVEYSKVTRTFSHVEHDLVAVAVADKRTGRVVETVRATRDHPFFTPKGMVAAGELGIGTQIVTRAGPHLVVAGVTREHSEKGFRVYNLEVEGYQTYFVGKAGGGLWVHNACDKSLFYLVDHNVPNFGAVAAELQRMGYNAASVVRKFGVPNIKDPNIITNLRSEFGESWRVITKDLTPGGFPTDKIIHVEGGNSTSNFSQVMDILTNKHGF